MDESSLKFLKKLLETPGPSGFEGAIQGVVKEYAKTFAEKIETDLHGNVILSRNGSSPRRVMFAGHCDQIGLIVSHIDDNGFIYSQTIGGWDPQQLIGQRMTIWSAGGPVPAVISRKPIHLQSDAERKEVAKLEDLWLDIGAKDREDAASVVKVGDAVTLELGMRTLRNGLATSAGMDNRTGLWVVVEGLRRIKKEKLTVGVFAVSTVAEEIGLRGARTSAFGIDPQIGIAVDVTHATDCPTIDKRQQGNIKLGKGPVIFLGPNMSPVVTQRLEAAATSRVIPYQPSAIGRATSNDANNLQISRAGVATGLVSIPNRYMHSAVETVSLDDLDHAANLLAAFVEDLSPEDDLRPW
jgi:putative aminopeptidase FrvX